MKTKQEIVSLIEVYNRKISECEEELAFFISERDMYQLQLNNIKPVDDVVDNQSYIKHREFVDDVSEFYCGDDGLYSEYFKNKLVKSMVVKMLPGFLKNYKMEFVGDSVDRENFRDYMMNELNMK